MVLTATRPNEIYYLITEQKYSFHIQPQYAPDFTLVGGELLIRANGYSPIDIIKGAYHLELL